MRPPALVAGAFKGAMDQRDQQIGALTTQITELRKQGQGLQQGFTILQKGGAAQDSEVDSLAEPQQYCRCWW
jgi:hypothetical protein